MKKGAKAQKLESVVEVEEEASKLSIDPKKEKKSSSRKSSKDKKEDKEKSKKDKKPTNKEPAPKDEQKEIKVEKPEPIPEAPKETISSVFRDLDQLSNHLAQTFQSFQTQKVTPSYHARFFEENEEQRHYASHGLGEKGYVEISAQGFNGSRNSNNYYSESKNYQRRPEEREKVWYNMPEKELLQRYMFREDDIRGETPFYDQSRGYIHKPRLNETPQKRSVHPDSGYSALDYSGGMDRREQIANKNDIKGRYYVEADAEEKYYEALHNQPRPAIKQGRSIKELYKHQSRHLFVEPEMESSKDPGQKIPGRSPQATMSMKSRSVSEFKNNGSVYINRLFG